MPHSKTRESQNERIYFTPAQAAIMIIVLLLAMLLLVSTGCTRQAENENNAPNQPPISSKPQTQVESVKLYFADQDAAYLKPEVREITLEGKPLAEAVVEELIKGPEDKELNPTIPPQTKLLSLQVTDGVAYVNFSKEIQTKHWGGSTGEIMTVYSVVNTLADLGEDIEKVQFLVEGEKQETLVGHLDTIEPISPDWRLVSSGEISLSTVSPDEDKVREIQKNVEQNQQLWRLDPLQTAKEAGAKFGFDPRKDTFELISKEEQGGTDGKAVAKVLATHNGEEYIIQLIQPDKQGPEGIWVINSVTMNK